MIKHFKNLLWQLQHRGNMYLGENTYTALTHFLTGYLLALRDVSGIDVGSAFHSNVQQKYRKSFAINAEAYLLEYEAKGDEQEAERVLFELWEEFLDMENPALEMPGY